MACLVGARSEWLWMVYHLCQPISGVFVWSFGGSSAGEESALDGLGGLTFGVFARGAPGDGLQFWLFAMDRQGCFESQACVGAGAFGIVGEFSGSSWGDFSAGGHSQVD